MNQRGHVPTDTSSFWIVVRATTVPRPNLPPAFMPGSQRMTTPQRHSVSPHPASPHTHSSPCHPLPFVVYSFYHTAPPRAASTLTTAYRAKHPQLNPIAAVAVAT